MASSWDREARSPEVTRRTGAARLALGTKPSQNSFVRDMKKERTRPQTASTFSRESSGNWGGLFPSHSTIRQPEQFVRSTMRQGVAWMKQRSRFDLCRLQPVSERLAKVWIVDDDRTHPEGIHGIRQFFQCLQRQALQALSIPSCDLALFFEHRGRIFELRKANSRANISHAIIVSHRVVPVLSHWRNSLHLEMVGPGQ